MVVPIDWPPKRGAQPAQFSAKLTGNNTVYVRAGSGTATILLSPRMIDFTKQVTIAINGRRVNTGDRFVEPDLKTLLEDARTRADRQNVFWAKVDSQTGRVVTSR